MKKSNPCIGLVGVGGTGKTTVLNRLSKQYELTTVPSVARMVFKTFGLESEDDLAALRPEARLHIQEEILRRKIQVDAASAKYGFITDRTPLDTLAYLVHSSADILSKEMFAELLRKTIDALRTYDLLVYFPLHVFQKLNDTFRVSAYGRHLITSQTMKDFLNRFTKELEIPVVELVTGKLDDRILTIEMAIWMNFGLRAKEVKNEERRKLA